MIGVWNLVFGSWNRRFKLPLYTVIFKDYDGTVLKTEKVYYGKDATPPSDPSRSGYTFDGWSGSYTNIKQDTIVTATYTEDTVYYYVRFYDYDGTWLDTDKVEEGYSATPPSDPTRSGYRFDGWDGDYTGVYSDESVYATYVKTWSVKFYDTDGSTILDTDIVDDGDDASPPSVTAPEGYRVVWNGNYTNVQTNESVYLEYHIKVYTVTFYHWDGTLHSYQDIEHGGTCIVPDEPDYKPDGKTSDDWAGWECTTSTISTGWFTNVTSAESFKATWM